MCLCLGVKRKRSTSITSFLMDLGLESYIPLFVDEQIHDVDTLALLKEDELKRMGLKLGPLAIIRNALQ